MQSLLCLSRNFNTRLPKEVDTSPFIFFGQLKRLILPPNSCSKLWDQLRRGLQSGENLTYFSSKNIGAVYVKMAQGKKINVLYSYDFCFKFEIGLFFNINL